MPCGQFPAPVLPCGWKVRLAPESQPRAPKRAPGGLGCSHALLPLRSVLAARADCCWQTQTEPLHCVQKCLGKSYQVRRGCETGKFASVACIKEAYIILERCLLEAILCIKSLLWCFGALLPIMFLDQFSLKIGPSFLCCTKQQREKKNLSAFLD